MSDMIKTKLRVDRAIEFVKRVALVEPTEFRVEEIDDLSVVLSYKENMQYNWAERIIKVITFGENDIPIAMKIWK